MPPASPARGRPRSFDTDACLVRAVEVFWATGYAATTYADLERGLGLHRQSLVYAFGDKRSLFVAALGHYADQRVARFERVLAEGEPLDGVRAAVAGWIEDARRARTPGCFVVSTAGEVGSRDPEISAVLGRTRQRLVDALARRLAAAGAEGSLPGHVDPRGFARLVVAAGDGALLHARAESDPDFAASALTALLDCLAG